MLILAQFLQYPLMSTSLSGDLSQEGTYDCSDRERGPAPGSALLTRLVRTDPRAVVQRHRVVRGLLRRGPVRVRLPVPDPPVRVPGHQHPADAAVHAAVRRGDLLRLRGAG